MIKRLIPNNSIS